MSSLYRSNPNRCIQIEKPLVKCILQFCCYEDEIYNYSQRSTVLMFFKLDAVKTLKFIFKTLISVSYSMCIYVCIVF